MENCQERIRVSLLGLPLDILDEENISKVIESLPQEEGANQIVFLSYGKFLRSMMSKSYRHCLKGAALIVPTSKVLTRAAGFVHRTSVAYFNPFNFVIRFLGVLEQKTSSVYLLGSTKPRVQAAERNLRVSFPGLSIVGRSSGRLASAAEQDVVTAIQKAGPSLLLAGGKLSGKDIWLTKRKTRFNRMVLLWSDEVFDIFSGKRQKNNRGRVTRKRKMFSVLFFPVTGLLYLLFLVSTLIQRLIKK